MNHDIMLPTQPKIISEKDFLGVYEIDALYPGYGHTLGNSLRRIILSSLPGVAITHISIDGIDHEFSTIDGMKENVISLLLNLKKIRFNLIGEENVQTIELHAKGEGVVLADHITVPGQVEILNKDQYLVTLTKKTSELKMTMKIQRGIGYLSREELSKEKTSIGDIALDAIFSPIRRVNYEVENMRVGDRTDFNKLRISIETDGTISPKDVLARSVEIMLKQIRAIVGFAPDEEDVIEAQQMQPEKRVPQEEPNPDFLKTRIESLGLSTRTENALINANIRTVGGIVRKKKTDLLSLEGLGQKALEEITDTLEREGVHLRD